LSYLKWNVITINHATSFYGNQEIFITSALKLKKIYYQQLNNTKNRVHTLKTQKINGSGKLMLVVKQVSGLVVAQEDELRF